jgi:hypothetical protein
MQHLQPNHHTMRVLCSCSSNRSDAASSASKMILRQLPDAQASARTNELPITGRVPLPTRRPTPPAKEQHLVSGTGPTTALKNESCGASDERTVTPGFSSHPVGALAGNRLGCQPRCVDVVGRNPKNAPRPTSPLSADTAEDRQHVCFVP